MSKKSQSNDMSLWERVKKTVNPLSFNKKNIAAPENDAIAPAPLKMRVMKDEQKAKKTPLPQKSLPQKSLPQKSLPQKLSVEGRLDPKQVRRLQSGKEKIDARLDLHGYRVEEAHAGVKRFILATHARKLGWVCIITGKGVRGEGVLRQEVPLWLNSSELAPLIGEFATAPPKMGGTGALIIRLRKNPKA